MKPKLSQYFTQSTLDFLMILLLLLFWGIGILIVGTDGDFPLNDDWAYASSVFSIAEEGHLVLDLWPAMSLIAQIGMGAAYCEFFSCTYETLRWSTLVNSFLCICFFYFLLRKFATVPIAFFVSLLLFFNPLFFSLSFTFMTEVHFLMAMMGAMLFFSSYIQSSKLYFLILGSLFSVLAMLIRQPGILVPLSFGMVLIYREKRILRKIVGFLPFIFSYICLKLYQTWLTLEHPEVYKVGGVQHIKDSLAGKAVVNIVESSVNLLLYPGLFLLPLVILLLPGINWSALKTNRLLLAAVLLFSVFLGLNLHTYPTGNVFYNIGLGPKLMKGVGWSPEPNLRNDLWKIIDYLSLLGATGIFLLIIQNIGLKIKLFLTQKEVSDKTLIKWSISLFCCGYFLLIVLVNSLFDRYALPLIPCLAVLILPQSLSSIKKYNAFAITWLVIFGLFSLAATHDYLSWNRARSEAFSYLNEEKLIPPTFIDAGFEINASLKAGPCGKSPGKSWWFVTEDDYVLAFENLNGYKKEKTYPYQTYLTFETDTLFILKEDIIDEIPYNEFPVSCDFEIVDDSCKHFLSNHPKVISSSGELQTFERARSGEHAIMLNAKNKFGATTKLWDLKPGDQITISIWRYPMGSNTALVIGSNYQKTFRKTINKEVIRQENGWEQIQADITVPPYSGTDRISIFIWNISNNEVWLDDLVINRKKSN